MYVLYIQDKHIGIRNLVVEWVPKHESKLLKILITWGPPEIIKTGF